MNMRLVVLFVVFSLFVYFSSLPDYMAFDKNQLYSPSCNIEEEILVTKVYYFVDSSLINTFTKDKAKEQIIFSNETLKNTCIPLTRDLETIEYIDFKFSGSEIYLENLHSKGSEEIGKSEVVNLRSDPQSYYVFVVPESHDIFEGGYTGITDWEFNDSFVLLADSAMPYVLEHEFGHLMFANHHETLLFSLLQGQLERSTRPENRHFIKPYARAYKCSNAGTVMSLEKVRLPVYSSPEIQYRSEVCGSHLHGDNKRRVREFVDNLRAKLNNKDSS